MDFEEEVVKDTSVEQARLTKLIEAIVNLLENKDWRTLQELHFSQEEERVSRLLLGEAHKSPLDDKEIYRLQGEMKWARRYADLVAFVKLLKNQLDKLK